MGLTDKALDELVEIGSEGLSDESSDEDLETKANSLVPFAKAMQGEITRKMSKRTQSNKHSKQGEGDGENRDEDDDETPEWFKKQMKGVNDRLQALQDENEALKAEKTKSERSTLIAEKAKALGIPDYLMKRVSFADDADLDKELADYKQELVTNNLMPKEQTHEAAKTKEEAMKADAEAWAKSLPSN